MAPRGRNLALWTIAAAVVATSAVIIWSVVGISRDAKRALSRGPSVPAPSAADAAATPLTSDGVRLTIKQRNNAWLPGGKLKLHVDDITGGQVIVSVTDGDNERVVFGPKSVKKGDKLAIADMEIEVVRLENLLVGSGDFGEFDVKLAPATTTRGAP